MLNTKDTTVSARGPGRPLPRCDWTDASLAFNFSCTRQMDSYVGLPMISWMVGSGKLSRILSVDSILVVGLAR